MWWSGALAFIVALISPVTCTPIERVSSPVTTQVAANGHYVTSGISTRDSGGHPYIRREIRDLFTNFPDQWALYLMGLLKFQQVDQSDPLSYYRISGIHAQPYEIWQDAYGVPDSAVGAYCPHASRLFITWHRPYLALFEQELWKHVRSIADQAREDRERWSAAADAFRLPYWDTARGTTDGGIPDFLISPRWTVVGPNGTQLIDNPLFWYQFHPLIEGDFTDPDIARYNQTMRWPTSHYSDAKPQIGELQNSYLYWQKNRQDDVHNAFLETSSFANFSQKLEDAHALIHIGIGGWGQKVDDKELHGHMFDPSNSAFDPIFMLHHANFDRLLALYTTANPGVWIEPAVVDEDRNRGNFWIPTNAITDANYGLEPFWKSETAFYTSEDVRNIDVFGYAYPETQYWNFGSEEEWRNDVRSIIQRLYSNSARATLTNAIAGGSDVTHVMGEGNTFTNWVIEAKASAKEMPKIFRVIFSLVGDFSSDGSTDVGMWTRLVDDNSETGTWKARQAERKAKRSSTIEQGLSGTISLTSSLLDQIIAGKLESLDPEAVVPYLKAHLTWNVFAGIESKRMTPDQLDSFTVKVISTKVRIPEDPSQPLEYSSDTTPYLMGKEE